MTSFRVSILLVALGVSIGPVLAWAGEPTPAGKRVDDIQMQLESARDNLEAAANRVEALERSLAEAERQVVRETVARARQGDEAALNEVLATLDTESVVVDSLWCHRAL